MRVLFISLAFIFIPIIPNAPNTASAEEDKQEWSTDCNEDIIVKEKQCIVSTNNRDIGLAFYLKGMKSQSVSITVYTMDQSKVEFVKYRINGEIASVDECLVVPDYICLLFSSENGYKQLRNLISEKGDVAIRVFTKSRQYEAVFKMKDIKKYIPKEYLITP